jgi:hypothetical protein
MFRLSVSVKKQCKVTQAKNSGVEPLRDGAVCAIPFSLLPLRVLVQNNSHTWVMP